MHSFDELKQKKLKLQRKTSNEVSDTIIRGRNNNRSKFTLLPTCVLQFTEHRYPCQQLVIILDPAEQQYHRHPSSCTRNDAARPAFDFFCAGLRPVRMEPVAFAIGTGPKQMVMISITSEIIYVLAGATPTEHYSTLPCDIDFHPPPINFFWS